MTGWNMDVFFVVLLVFVSISFEHQKNKVEIIQ